MVAFTPTATLHDLNCDKNIVITVAHSKIIRMFAVSNYIGNNVDVHRIMLTKHL